MSFPGMGGDNSVLVEINGNSAPLVDALALAQDALAATSASMAAVGAASEEMAASSAVGADGLEAEGAAATTTAGRLDGLLASVRATAAGMADLAGVMGGGVGAVGEGVAGIGAAMRGNGVLSLFGDFGMMVEGLGGKIMPFLSSMTAMVAGFAALGVIEDAIGEVRDFTDSLVELNIQTEKNQFSWRYLYGGGNTPQGAAIAQGIADWTKKFSINIPYTRQDLLNAITNLAPMGLSAQGLEHYMPMIADLAATRDPNATLQQVAQVIMSASMGYTRMLKYDLKINPEDLLQYGLNATGTGVGLHINDPSTLLPALENYAKAKNLTGAANDIAHDTFWGAWSSFLDRIQNFELDTGKGLFGSLKDALNNLSSWIDEHYDQINRLSALLSDTLGGAFNTVATDIGDLMRGAAQSGFLDFLGLGASPAPAATAPPAVTGTPPTTAVKVGGSTIAVYTPKVSTTHGPTHDRANRANAAVTADDGTARDFSHGTTRGQRHDQFARGTGNADTALDRNSGNAPPTSPNLTAWQQLGEALGKVGNFFGWVKDQAIALFGALNTLGGGDILKSIGDNLTTIGNALTPQDKELIKDVAAALLIMFSAPVLVGVGLLAAGLQLVVWWMQNAEPAILSLANTIMTTLGNAVKWITDRFGDLIGKIKDLLQWLHILPANYGGLGVSATPKGSEPAAKNGPGVRQDSLSVHGGYANAAAAGSGTTVINIHGAGTAEMLRVIDYASQRRDSNGSSATRAIGRLPAYAAFPTINGGPF